MQPAVDAARPGAIVAATPEDTLPDAATMMAAAPTAGPRHWMALDTWKPPTWDAQAPSPTARTASEISCCDAAMDTSAAVVDKQQRAEKRKEANKALRRKKRAEAALGAFAVGSAATLLAAH